MIPIALSYRIIKGTGAVHTEERKIQTLDITAMKKAEIFSSEDEETLGESPEVRIRRELKKILREEMEEERQKLLKAAKEASEKEAEALKKKALEEGFEAGRVLGIEKGYEETMSFRDNALSMLLEAEKMSKDYLYENEERVVRLSSAIAEKIVEETISASDESVMLLARPILEAYGKAESVILTCHPEKLEFLKCRLPEMKLLCPKARILILQDKNLDVHDIIVENEDQITDLSIRKQLARFVELALE